MTSRTARFRIAPTSSVLEESWKYCFVSALALSVDYSLLITLTEYLRIYYLFSAAIGFVVGSVVNYVLSLRFVFKTRRLKSQRDEFLFFFVIGIAGLALNEVTMKVAVDLFGAGYVVAKMPAAALGFVFNFSARRMFLFSERNGSVGI